MGYLTDTSTITTTLQSINCRFSKMGITYISNLERGLTNDSALSDIEKGFSMLDSIVGYRAPSAEVLATGVITITSDSGGTIRAFVNGIAISSAVASTGVINTTATNLASSINSNLLYTATSLNNIVTVKALIGTGSNPNNLPLTVTAASMVASSTNFTGGVTTKTDTQYTVKFASSQDRLSSVPTAIGVVGLQTDTDIRYISTGTSAGNWVFTTTDCVTLPEVNNIISALKKLCKN